MKVEFPGSLGLTLSARLDVPDQSPKAFALFAHCFTCSKDTLAASRIARALVAEGIAVLRFDFTGLGNSHGDFANTNFSSNIGDLVAAAEFLAENYTAPSILIGHSLGGAAVLAATHRIPSTKAVVTIAAPCRPDHVVELLSAATEEIRDAGEAEVNLGGRTFRIQKQLLDDLEMQNQPAKIGALSAALLVMHSPTDDTVGVDNARDIFDAARHPKSFVALDGADHLLTKPADSQFAAGVIAAWASRYAFGEIPDTDVASQASAPAMTRVAAVPTAPGVVVVSGNAHGAFGQDLFLGAHHLLADEPAPLGLDTGPSPYDLLLAGLGACTSMTLKMFADRKNIPLAHVSVELKHARIHAEDCEHCDTAVGMVDQIERVITLTGDLSDAQRQTLLEIADKCPVHRTLTGEISITTALVT